MQFWALRTALFFSLFAFICMPRFAANLSFQYNEYAFLDRFSAAASDGFKGVEYLFPYAFAPSVLAEQ